MNTVYRLIWNATLNLWQVASELARAHGKGSHRSARALRRMLLAAGALLAAPAFAAPALTELPSGGQVVAGSASIGTSGARMDVNQTTQRGAIDWQTFNIGAQAHVNFNQPAGGATLNRVLDTNASQIYGKLTSTGQVFLVNPNGVLFAPGAQVDVGSLIASTRNIGNADFMAGSLKFEGDSSGAIINRGNIKVGAGGTVAFIAAKITNEGGITAPQGNVLLGAGNKITLDLGGPVKLQVEQGALDALIEQGGAIKADGGRVYLTAQAANLLATAVINQTGVIEARSLSANEQGEIILQSGYAIIHTGTLDASGETGGRIALKTHNLIDAGQTLANGQTQGGDIRIDATGRVLQTTAATLQANGGSGAGGNIRIEANESAWLSGSLSATGRTGGDISLTAPELTLAETKVNASGETAGGRIRAGGGWQGKDADLANALRTRVVAAEFDVSATQRGNGGTAVVWSDAETLFGGRIAARGGAQGGNGGQVEVSSHDKLSFGGLVDAGAPNGSNGSLLLDPKNIDIVASVSASGFNLLSLPDPTPSVGENFGASGSVVELKNNGVSTDRIVVASPYDDAAATDAGAVYLYNSQTGALISTLTGWAGDYVGSSGVTALSNGNYVVSSANWRNGIVSAAGAVTWGNGSTGISGAVSATNSLVGSKANDYVGSDGVTALTNGNYVVISPYWNNGAVADVGAATWGNGSTGTSGAVSATNSLVGSKANDQVGSNKVIALTNGNYVVNSPSWDNGAVVNAGAATWGNGSTGTVGTVSATNSLVGSTAGDWVSGNGVTALTNGNYVVRSILWDNGGVVDAGAVSWGNGSTGTVGAVSATNSLVGSTAGDQVGASGLRQLTNGNYLVPSQYWDNGAVVNAGAVTWGNGSTGTVGVVSATNSLVGSTADDWVGSSSATVLTNGNYVVISPYWGNGIVSVAGAVTWGNGSTGTVGTVSATNSLVGSTTWDSVGNGGVTALTNGNYVVGSGNWDNGAVADVGAATWGNGSTGISGAVSATNSLVGSTASDYVGITGATALSNGNYVVISPYWDNGIVSAAGAVTWGNGSTGTVGTVSATNSLVGSTTNDRVGVDGAGANGVTALSNGNYVVSTSFWNNGGVAGAGAVTWGNGSTGTVGTVSATNSLVGSTTNDRVGSTGVTALTNGNYVVRTQYWDGTVADAGAVTWGNGSTGISGTISASNSLVGSTAFDYVGSGQAIALADGRFLIGSHNWDRTTPSSIANAGRVDILSAAGTAASLPLNYATDPSASSSLLASTLLATLDAGTAVTLQANNDITLSTALAVNNASGNGGALTLQAGRSILLNANLTTDNGNLTLIANDRAANGVVNANRDAGAANITQAAGTTINAGTGTVSIDLRDGAGNTNNTVGTVTLASVNAASLSVQSAGFTASASASNKTYDGNTSAILSAASASGLAFQSGSNLSLANPTTGVFADKNAGTGKAVTSSSFQITGYNGANASDLLKGGSALTASTAANINKAALTATIAAASKTYNGNTTATPTFAITGGLVGTETVTATGAATFNTKDAGTGKTVTANSNTLADGTNGGLASNYSLVTGQTTTVDIGSRPVTVTADAKSKPPGQPDPALTYTTGCGNLTGDCGLVSGDSLSGALTRVAGESLGNYAIQQDTVTNVNNPNYQIAFVGADLSITSGGTNPASGGINPASGGTNPAITSAQQAASIGGNTSPGGAGGIGTDGNAPSIGSGLVFVEITGSGDNSSQPQGGGADAGAGRDVSGFIRVFVVNGGINLAGLTRDDSSRNDGPENRRQGGR